MKMTKKSKSLIAILLLAAVGNACGMDLPEIDLSALVNEVGVAPTLAGAAQRIRVRASKDAELKRQIDDPKDCLKLIKLLAKKYNCDHDTVAKILTQESRKRLELQEEFLDILAEGFGDVPTIMRVMQKFVEEGGADVNFVHSKYGTPLSHFAKRVYLLDGGSTILRKLIAYGADPKLANSRGVTPLKAAEEQLKVVNEWREGKLVEKSVHEAMMATKKFLENAVKQSGQ